MWMTNEKRCFFGLAPIQDEWDAVQLTPTCTIYFEGDTIVKRIECNEDQYLEKDIEIETRARQMILPKTARGKEKKLTYSTVENRRDGTILFRYMVYRQEGYIEVKHLGTKRELPFASFQAESLADIEEVLTAFMQSPPAIYEEKRALLYKKLKRHKIQVGDVFKVERSMTTHSYVVVIGHVQQMRKAGLIAEASILNDLMTVPLFVRAYELETEEELTVDQIKEYPMYEGCQVVMDDPFMRGQSPFVGRIDLQEKDLEFPFGFGPSLKMGANYSRVSWGLATAMKDGLPTGEYDVNNGVSFGVTFESIPFDHENYERAFQFLGIAPLDFDRFNEQYNGLTKAQYLAYVQPEK